jgi:hypothetical protein
MSHPLLNQFFAEVYASNDPLIIEVKDGRWTADPGPHPRLIVLYVILMIISGGYSGELEDGTYHFVMKSNWFKAEMKMIDPADPDRLL